MTTYHFDSITIDISIEIVYSFASLLVTRLRPSLCPRKRRDRRNPTDMLKGPTVTDREIMAAIYLAVEKMYERVVGERLIISVPTEDGQSTLGISSLGLHIPERSEKESLS